MRWWITILWGALLLLVTFLNAPIGRFGQMLVGIYLVLLGLGHFMEDKK